VTCPDCDKVMISEKIEGELHCEECGLIYDTRLPGVKDIESVNTSRSYYSLKMNLLKAIHKFEGKQSSVTNSDLEIIITEIQKRRLNRQLLKCEHLLKILKDLKLVKYYDEVYSLLPLLTNKQKKSIQPFIPQILKLHDELEYAYSSVKNPNRINSLNVYFKLYKLLKLCDKDFDISDLCTLKTEQKFEEHEEKWKEICKITGWPV
jgi:DNA-directed RNA polymerase subunit M/transcription elongation factor TFIIS